MSIVYRRLEPISRTPSPPASSLLQVRHPLPAINERNPPQEGETRTITNEGRERAPGFSTESHLSVPQSKKKRKAKRGRLSVGGESKRRKLLLEEDRIQRALELENRDEGEIFDTIRVAGGRLKYPSGIPSNFSKQIGTTSSRRPLRKGPRKPATSSLSSLSECGETIQSISNAGGPVDAEGDGFIEKTLVQVPVQPDDGQSEQSMESYRINFQRVDLGTGYLRSTDSAPDGLNSDTGSERKRPNPIITNSTTADVAPPSISSEDISPSTVPFRLPDRATHESSTIQPSSFPPVAAESVHVPHARISQSREFLLDSAANPQEITSDSRGASAVPTPSTTARISTAPATEESKDESRTIDRQPNRLSLNFTLVKFGGEANQCQIRGDDIYETNSERVSWPSLELLLDKRWGLNLSKQRILVNWAFPITTQQDLDDCMVQLRTFGRKYHEIILCDLDDGNMSEEVRDTVQKLEDHDKDFWMGKEEELVIEARSPTSKKSVEIGTIEQQNSTSATGNVGGKGKMQHVQETRNDTEGSQRDAVMHDAYEENEDNGNGKTIEHPGVADYSKAEGTQATILGTVVDPPHTRLASSINIIDDSAAANNLAINNSADSTRPQYNTTSQVQPGFIAPAAASSKWTGSKGYRRLGIVTVSPGSEPSDASEKRKPKDTANLITIGSPNKRSAAGTSNPCGANAPKNDRSGGRRYSLSPPPEAVEASRWRSGNLLSVTASNKNDLPLPEDHGKGKLRTPQDAQDNKPASKHHSTIDKQIGSSSPIETSASLGRKPTGGLGLHGSRQSYSSGKPQSGLSAKWNKGRLRRSSSKEMASFDLQSSRSTGAPDLENPSSDSSQHAGHGARRSVSPIDEGGLSRAENRSQDFLSSGNANFASTEKQNVPIGSSNPEPQNAQHSNGGNISLDSASEMPSMAISGRLALARQTPLTTNDSLYSRISSSYSAIASSPNTRYINTTTNTRGAGGAAEIVPSKPSYIVSAGPPIKARRMVSGPMTSSIQNESLDASNRNTPGNSASGESDKTLDMDHIYQRANLLWTVNGGNPKTFVPVNNDTNVVSPSASSVPTNPVTSSQRLNTTSPQRVAGWVAPPLGSKSQSSLASVLEISSDKQLRTRRGGGDLGDQQTNETQNTNRQQNPKAKCTPPKRIPRPQPYRRPDIPEMPSTITKAPYPQKAASIDLHANARSQMEENRMVSNRTNLPNSTSRFLHEQPSTKFPPIPRPPYGKPQVTASFQNRDSGQPTNTVDNRYTQKFRPVNVFPQSPTYTSQLQRRMSISSIVTDHSNAAPVRFSRASSVSLKKMEPLVGPENFLYSASSTGTTKGLKADSNSIAGSAAKRLSAFERTALPIGVSSVSFPPFPALQRMSTPSPKPPLKQNPLEPGDIVFTIYRYKAPQKKLCIIGTDIASHPSSEGNLLDWNKLTTLIKCNMLFDMIREALVVNMQLLVDGQESLNKGFEWYGKSNSVIICPVDPLGRPVAKEIVDGMKKEHGRLRGAGGDNAAHD